MRVIVGAALAVGLLLSPAFAQPSGEDGAAPAPGPAPVASDSIALLPGDTVIFKTGNKLQGVQVVRETAATVEVKVTETDRLSIPRKQIERIEYDTVDPNRGDSEAVAPKARSFAIMDGVKIAPSLFKKMTSPLPEASLKIDEADYTEALVEIGKSLEVAIEFADTINQQPRRERMFSVTMEPGASLAQLIEDHVLSRFPALKLTFPEGEDKIFFSLRAGGE